MRRSSPFWMSAVLSAVFAAPLCSQTFAETPSAGSGDAPAAASSGTPAAPGGGAPGPKILHTIPEDGLGEEMFPASSRLVRDIVAVRQDEDLVICIAGCIPNRDRVVYAQPSDKGFKHAADASHAGQQDSAAATRSELVPTSGEPAKDAPAAN